MCSVSLESWSLNSGVALVLTYSAVFGIMVYRYHQCTAIANPPEKFDIEGTATPRLPITQPSSSNHNSITFTASRHMSGTVSHPPWLSAPPPRQTAPDAPITDDDDAESPLAIVSFALFIIEASVLDFIMVRQLMTTQWTGILTIK